jgi:hypothetical protein
LGLKRNGSKKQITKNK